MGKSIQVIAETRRPVMALRERSATPMYTERRRTAPWIFTPGMVLGALSSAAVIVSMFLSWRSGSVHPSDVPASFLWDRNATSDPSLLIFLIPLAVVLVIGTFMPMGAALRLLGGLGVIVVAGLFAYQLHEITNDLNASFGDALDSGFYFAA